MFKHRPFFFRTPEAGGGGGDPEPNPPAAPPTPTEGGEDGKGGKGKVTFTAEQQAAVDAIIKERLDRQAEKHRKDAEKAKADADAAAAKAKEDADAAALAEQNKFKELAEQRQGKIEKLEKEVAGLKAEVADFERHKAALTKFRDAELAGVPDHLKPLLDKLDLPDQLEWLANNRATLKKSKDGVPPTPPPEGEGEMSDEQRKAAQEAASQHYLHAF